MDDPNRCGLGMDTVIKGCERKVCQCFTGVTLVYIYTQLAPVLLSVCPIVLQAPYHVDALLAMYDLYRHMGENSYAGKNAAPMH